MNLKFTHFLLTRFNLDYVNFNKFNNEFNYLNWYKDRVDLFYKYCYPTIICQYADFKWLIIFDESTQDEDIIFFLEKDVFRKLEILKTNSINLIDDLNEYIKNNKNRSEIIITTNMDSDDGFLGGALNEIQKFHLISDNFPFLINVENGYIVDVKTGIFYLKSFKCNPFISMVECDFPYKTCLIDDHNKLSNNYPVYDFNESFFWLQNIHRGNIANTIKGSLLIYGRNRISESKLYRDPNIVDYLKSLILVLIRKIRNFFHLFNKKK